MRFIILLFLLFSLQATANEEDIINKNPAPEDKETLSTGEEYEDDLEEYEEVNKSSNKNVTNLLTEEANITSTRHNAAIIRILDKVIAKLDTKNIRTNLPFKKDNLYFNIEKCITYSKKKDSSEDMMLLRVYNQDEYGEKNVIFHGWIFADSPSLSIFIHPKYDINLVKCDE
jgi:hypothetical protein